MDGRIRQSLGSRDRETHEKGGTQGTEVSLEKCPHSSRVICRYKSCRRDTEGLVCATRDSRVGRSREWWSLGPQTIHGRRLSFGVLQPKTTPVLRQRGRRTSLIHRGQSSPGVSRLGVEVDHQIGRVCWTRDPPQRHTGGEASWEEVTESGSSRRECTGDYTFTTRLRLLQVLLGEVSTKVKEFGKISVIR